MVYLVLAPLLGLVAHAGSGPRPPPPSCGRKFSQTRPVPPTPTRELVLETYDRFIAVALGQARGKKLGRADYALTSGVRAAYAEIFGRDLEFPAIAVKLLARDQTHDDGVLRAVETYVTPESVRPAKSHSKEKRRGNGDAPPTNAVEKHQWLFDDYQRIARKMLAPDETVEVGDAQFVLDIESLYSELHRGRLNREFYAHQDWAVERIPMLTETFRVYVKRLDEPDRELPDQGDRGAEATPRLLERQENLYEQYRGIARREVWAHGSAEGPERQLMLDIEKIYRERWSKPLDRRLTAGLAEREPTVMRAVTDYLERVEGKKSPAAVARDVPATKSSVDEQNRFYDCYRRIVIRKSYAWESISPAERRFVHDVEDNFRELYGELLPRQRYLALTRRMPSLMAAITLYLKRNNK